MESKLGRGEKGAGMLSGREGCMDVTVTYGAHVRFELFDLRVCDVLPPHNFHLQLVYLLKITKGEVSWEDNTLKWRDID